MKVIFDGIYLDGVSCFDIEDESSQTLEAVYYANLLKSQYGAYPDYFFFTDDFQSTGRYYINKKIITKKEMKNIDETYYNHMNKAGIERATFAYDKKGEKILYIYPLFSVDKVITIN